MEELHLAFYGKMRAGKDTAANYLINKYLFKNLILG
jgi:hypothetical protein